MNDTTRTAAANETRDGQVEPKQSPWADEQERRGVHLINRTYLARIPCGDVVEVNRFDYNIHKAAGALDKYIQLADAAWIRVRNLTLLTAEEQSAFIAAGAEVN